MMSKTDELLYRAKAELSHAKYQSFALLMQVYKDMCAMIENNTVDVSNYNAWASLTTFLEYQMRALLPNAGITVFPRKYIPWSHYGPIDAEGNTWRVRTAPTPRHEAESRYMFYHAGMKAGWLVAADVRAFEDCKTAPVFKTIAQRRTEYVEGLRAINAAIDYLRDKYFFDDDAVALLFAKESDIKDALKALDKLQPPAQGFWRKLWARWCEL